MQRGRGVHGDGYFEAERRRKVRKRGLDELRQGRKRPGIRMYQPFGLEKTSRQVQHKASRDKQHALRIPKKRNNGTRRQTKRGRAEKGA